MKKDKSIYELLNDKGFLPSVMLNLKIKPNLIYFI